MIKNIIFSQKILTWYKNFKVQDLPWKLNQTIYHTWLSEIMLQQTQVKTVIPYYTKFIEIFPSITKLAAAKLNEILYLWSGLGYYTRARNLHKTAKIITKYYNGIFPTDFNTLISLPGIGQSTAGAILSLALNQKYPILDGNIKRILTRYYTISYYAANKSTIEHKLWDLSKQLMPDIEVSMFNQAMMNLGRLICTNKNPSCKNCPINNECKAFLTHTITQYPTKIPKKINKKTIWLLLLLQQHNKIIWLEQRLKSKIWKELFCFPEFSNINTLNNWLITHNLNCNQCKNMDILKYKISNLNLEINPILLNINKKFDYHNKNGIWCEIDNLPTIGIPTPVFIILKKLKMIYTNI